MTSGNKIKNELLKKANDALEEIQEQIAYLESDFSDDYNVILNGSVLSPEKIAAGTRMMEALRPVEAGLTPAAYAKYPFAVLMRQLSCQRYYSSHQAASLLGKTKVSFLRDFVYNIYDPNLKDIDVNKKIAGFVLGQGERAPWVIFADSLEEFAKRNGIELREIAADDND